jgi:hypothetical protein
MRLTLPASFRFSALAGNEFAKSETFGVVARQEFPGEELESRSFAPPQVSEDGRGI